uniref:Uncharacterized protein n=1 Tax=Rhizophora mucronata TaxID=61149 RepID=A0A2P2LU28_RHIMU
MNLCHQKVYQHNVSRKYRCFHERIETNLIHELLTFSSSKFWCSLTRFDGQSTPLFLFIV